MKNMVIIGVCFSLAFGLSCQRGHSTDEKVSTQQATPSSKTSENIKKEATPKIPCETRCSKGNCSTFVSLKNSDKLFVAAYPKEPSCRSVSQNLLEILVSCGSPCSYSSFVDLASGKKSMPFFMVLAVDTLRGYLAFCDTSDIKIAVIFDTTKAPIAINRDYSHSATMSTVVDTAIFRTDGMFVFHYYSGKDFAGVWDSLEPKF
jgi:hypothetical protein